MAKIQPPSGKDLRGFVPLLPHLLTATFTATSEAGPRPGAITPTDSAHGTLLLESSGTFDGDLDDVELQLHQGGAVGTATYRWRYDGDTLWYNQDPPVMCSGWEFVSRSTTALKWTNAVPMRIPGTGRLLITVTEDSETVTVHQQGPQGKWTEITVEATDGTTTSCLVPLPSGRILDLYSWEESATVTQLRMSYSDDNGTTWTLGSPRCLPTPWAYASANIKRLRAVEILGSICLVVWISDGSADQVWQYISSDGGSTFTRIEKTSETDEAAPDLKVHDNVITLATVKRDTGRTYATHIPIVRRITSAGQKFSGVTAVSAVEDVAGNVSEWGTYAAGVFTSAECALLIEDTGDLWLYGSDHDGTASREIIVRRSSDGGDTWAQNGASGAPVPQGTTLHWVGNGTEYLKDFAVCMERSRAVLAHRFVSGAAGDDSLCAMYLGGPTTCGFPEDTSSDLRAGVCGWEVLYLPLDDPNTAGSVWTRTATGSPTTAGHAEGRTFATAGGETQYYTANPVLTSADKGILFEQELSLSSGTWIVELRISDGTNDYKIQARLSATTLDLYDANAAAVIGSAATVDATDTVVIRLALDKPSGAWSGNNGRARLLWRTSGPYNTADPVLYGPRAVRKWEEVASSSTCTSGAATTTRIRVGRIVAGASSATVRYWAYTPAPYIAGNLGASAVGKSRGQLVPPASTPVHVAEGLRLHGTGGLGVAGDLFTHETDHEHPVEAVLPAFVGDSPRRVWRGTSDAVQQDIQISGVDLGWRSGDLLAIGVIQTNVKTLSVWRDHTATDKVMDIDMSKAGVGLAYTRSRDLIYPKTGGASAGFHFRERALVGASVDLGGGVVRKVRTNEGGAWLASGGPGQYASARLWLEDYDAGDPTGAATMDLWMPSGLFLTEAMAATDKLMIRIPAQDTADGYPELKVVIGRFRVLAHEWGQGWSISWMPLSQLVTSSSGARRGRRREIGRAHV